MSEQQTWTTCSEYSDPVKLMQQKNWVHLELPVSAYKGAECLGTEFQTIVEGKKLGYGSIQGDPPWRMG